MLGARYQPYRPFFAETLVRASFLSITTAILVLGVAPAEAQTSADTAGIRATAHDYIDGWYAGDADRMERSLHPHLAKRLVYENHANQSALVDLTAEELVQATRAGRGKISRDQWRDSVTILDIFGNAAVVRVDATTWVDFLEEIKWNGAWKIINVVWENRPMAGKM
jgi:Putative lumazine-binding